MTVRERFKNRMRAYLSHFEHIEVLENIVLSICDIESKEISFAVECGGYDISRQKVDVCYFIFRSLIDVNSSLVNSLRSERYVSAESLTRVSVENSINLLYVIKSQKNSAVASLLKSHFDKSMARARSWEGYFKEIGDADGLRTARRRMMELQQNKNSVKGLDSAKGWPDARSRFKFVDMEHFYHDVFAPASDSIHSVAEDAFNYIFKNSLPAEFQAEWLELVMAQRSSYAIYLGINSASIFLEATREFCNLIDVDKDDYLVSKIENLNSLMKIHGEDELLVD